MTVRGEGGGSTRTISLTVKCSFFYAFRIRFAQKKLLLWNKVFEWAKNSLPRIHCAAGNIIYYCLSLCIILAHLVQLLHSYKSDPVDDEGPARHQTEPTKEHWEPLPNQQERDWEKCLRCILKTTSYMIVWHSQEFPCKEVLAGRQPEL